MHYHDIPLHPANQDSEPVLVLVSHQLLKPTDICFSPPPPPNPNQLNTPLALKQRVWNLMKISLQAECIIAKLKEQKRSTIKDMEILKQELVSR